MWNRLLWFAEFCESKKCKAVLGLFVTGMLLLQSVGCRERGTSVSGYAGIGSDDPRVIAQFDAVDRQIAKADEQQLKGDQQQLKVEEQARRFDVLLDKWDQQAQRYDTLLDRWEKAIAGLERIGK
ncbi:MAG: hypothetical protein AABZ47_14205 [Planctomycetota bacterium]